MSKVIQKSILKVTMLSAAMALVGCGGGNGGTIDSLAPRPDFSYDGGTNNSGNDGSSTSATLSISNLKLFANGVETRKVTVEGAIAKGKVVDENGKGIPNALVTFSGEGLIFGSKNGNGAVLTDKDGVASIKVKPSDNLKSGTYSMSASIEYEGESATSNTYFYELIANDGGGNSSTEPVNIGTIDLGGVKEITSAGVTAKVRVVNENNEGIADAPVSFKGGGVKYSTTNGTVLTGPGGWAEIVLYPKDPTDSGTYGISATVDLNGNKATSSFIYYKLKPGAVVAPTDNPVNFEEPAVKVDRKLIGADGATATIRVVDENNDAIPDAKVTFSGGGVTYDKTNGAVLTDGSGWATIKLYPADLSDSGTYGITATVEFGNDSATTKTTSYYQLEGSGDVVATEDVNIGAIALSETTIRKSGTKATVKIVDKDGNGIESAKVTFNAGGVSYSKGNGTVLTGKGGLAEIVLIPLDPTDTGTYGITATAEFKGETATSKPSYYQLEGGGDEIETNDPVNIGSIELGKTLIDSTGTTAKIKVVDKDGHAIKGALVTFNGGGVTYDKTNGTDLTDDKGIAEIRITPADATDSGTYGITATASFNGNSSEASNPSYYQLEPSSQEIGEPLTISEITMTNNGSDIANPVDADGTVTSAKATARVVIKDMNKEPVRGALVTFVATGGVTLSSSNGSVLTDGKGEATIVLTPASNKDTGAYTLSASATHEGDTTETVNYNFSLQALEIKLTDMKVTKKNLSSGDSTNVTLVTKDDNDIAQDGITVNFTAGCGTFSSDSVVSSDGGNVTTTYTGVDADGKLCSGKKTITASTSSGKSATAEVTIAEIKADSVVYTTSKPVVLGVKGSGTANTGKIQFTLYSNGIPVANKPVRISKRATSPTDLDIGTVGNKAPFIVESDSEGVVTVNLYPGYKSGPVEILAQVLDALSKDSVTDDTPILATALSKNVSVATGRAYQDGLSISTEKNVLRFQVDGDTTTVKASVDDRWGNAVPDGTVVSFTSEGGKIGSNCPTVNGECTVDFTTQNPRPLNGRVSVVAYLEGDKAYLDDGSDNTYVKGTDRLLYNIGDWFRDDNENRKFDIGERLYEKGDTGGTCFQFQFPLPALQERPYTSFNSPNIDGTCSNELTATLRHQFVMGMAMDVPFPENLPATLKESKNPWSFYLFGNGEKTLPMPSGTTVSVSAKDNTSYSTVPSVEYIPGEVKVTVIGAKPNRSITVKLGEKDYNFTTDSKGELHQNIITAYSNAAPELAGDAVVEEKEATPGTPATPTTPAIPPTPYIPGTSATSIEIKETDTVVRIFDAKPDTELTFILDGQAHDISIDSSGYGRKQISGRKEGSVNVLYEDESCSVELTHGYEKLPKNQALFDGTGTIDPESVRYTVSMKDCIARDSFIVEVTTPGNVTTKMVTTLTK